MTDSTPIGPDTPGIHAGRLSPERYAQHFCDSHAPLDPRQALIEADRCYYCFDAPCTAACPTAIDVPQFIQRINQGNIRGAARTILSANAFGGMCGRVCPTEILCEEACVRNTQQHAPVEIGQLQRYAVDTFLSQPSRPLFSRAASTGKRIAVVGAGPAGLTVAHRLAQSGHTITVFDSRDKPGGLNEYGLAAYKTTADFAQREVAWLLSIGGITIHQGQRLGHELSLASLRDEYDAVFLGLGLAGVNALSLPAPTLKGVVPAIDFIAELRQQTDMDAQPVGREVVVIGGGMTAVDAAVQAAKLGARHVSLVYRRGQEDMSASLKEQHWAAINRVQIHCWSAPYAFEHTQDTLTGVTFDRMQLVDGGLQPTGERYTLAADMVLTAIGQTFDNAPTGDTIQLIEGRIAVDAHGKTSCPGVWAGGDCCAGGLDLTVDAVRQGNTAAESIDQALSTSTQERAYG